MRTGIEIRVERSRLVGVRSRSENDHSYSTLKSL